MTDKNKASQQKIIVEVPNRGNKVQLESKGGAIPPTKVSVVMPPVKAPKK